MLKDPLNKTDNTKSPDLDFLEKVEGTTSENIPSENIEQASTDINNLEEKDNPILSESPGSNEEEYVQVASLFPKKLPKALN